VLVDASDEDKWVIQEAMVLWSGWWGKPTAKSALEQLKRRSLVSVITTRRDWCYPTFFERLQIHDVVRSLGLGILTRNGSRYYGSRLWSGGEFLDWSQVRCAQQFGVLCAFDPPRV
jgi:hypothetical protein